MRLNKVGVGAVALFVALSSAVAAATADDKPDVVDMIFEHKHLSNVAPGTEVDYRFNRLSSNADLLGIGFSDDISMKVVADKPSGKKDVDLQIYTGERARDLQKLPDLSINPVFLVYFNQAVNTFGQLAGGQRPYLTRLFSNAFKEKAKIEPVKVDYKGKQIDAYRITTVPYKGDVSEAKMQGWEDAQYVLVLSDQVPGEIIDLIAKYKNKYEGKGDLRLVERITLDGATGLEKTGLEETAKK